MIALVVVASLFACAWFFSSIGSPVLTTPLSRHGDVLCLDRDPLVFPERIPMFAVVIGMLGLVAAIASVCAFEQFPRASNWLAAASAPAIIYAFVRQRLARRRAVLRLTPTHLYVVGEQHPLRSITRVDVRVGKKVDVSRGDARDVRALVLAFGPQGGLETPLPLSVGDGDQFVAELRARIEAATESSEPLVRAELPRARVVEMPYTRDRDPA